MPIHSYVDDATHGEFEVYRKGLGFGNGSGLLSLLVLRELLAPKLAPAAGSDRSGPPRTGKVSAYLNADKADAFAAHVEALGRTVSNAGAELIRIEVEERWLEAALGWSPPRK